MRKKRFLTAILGILGASCLAFGVVACDEGVQSPQHTHTYAETWSKDESKHWKDATCEHTEEKDGSANHTWNTEHVCTVCGYEGKHGNEFVYTDNENGTHEKTYACCGGLVENAAHTWDEGKPDTANADGILFTCTACKATKTETPPSIHTHNATAFVAAAPSCDEDGNVAYWYCAGCDTRFLDEALTTEVSVADSTLPAAHTSAEFSYSVNAQDESKHDKKHACCGEVIETLSHEWNDGEPDTATPGLTLFTCTKCEKTKREGTPIVGHIHNPSVVAATPPTCDEDGNLRYWYCADCQTKFADEYLSTPISDDDVLWEKTGHSVDLWYFQAETPVVGSACTYSQSYRGTCSVCEEEASKTVTAVRHTLEGRVTTAAKCNALGEKTYVCANGCSGVVEVREYADPNAHLWAKTGESDNVATYTCGHCSKVKTVAEYSDSSATVDKSVLEQNEIALGEISLKLDTTTLSLVESGEVLVEAAALTPAQKETLAENLTGGVRDMVLNGPVYDFGLKQNDTYISNFGEGRVTVTVPYPFEVEDVDLLAVCYVADDGRVEIVGASYANGYITFEVKHFSVYVPTSVNEAEACVLYGHNYIEEKIPATCTERGYTVKNCGRCGKSVVTDIVYEKGHLWDSGEGTQPTCTTEGSFTYTCTRAGCEETLSVAVAKLSHQYEYEEENSKFATCTEGGYESRVCSVCGDRVMTTLQAYGHQMEYGTSRYVLAEGATSCEDGLVEIRYCGTYGCTYHEVVGTRHEHIALYDKGIIWEDYPQLAEMTLVINVLDYADFDYMQFTGGGGTEPTLTITPGCLCGELTESVEFNGGDIINDWANYSVHQIHETTKLIRIDGEMYSDPYLQVPDFNVLFKVRDDGEGCHHVIYVDVYVGGDEEGNEAPYTTSVWLHEYDSHRPVKTAELAEPGVSCWESSQAHPYGGIIETSTCKDCNTVTEVIYTSVWSSSKHHYLDCEGQTYSYTIPRTDTANRYHYNYFKLQACPCGTYYVDMDIDCSMDKTSAVVEGVEIEVYTCRYCDFCYGYLAVEDNSSCYKTTTYTYYVNLDISDDSYDAKLSYVAGYYYHRQTTQETPLPSTDPCFYDYESVTTCMDCGKEISRGVYTRATHDENRTESVDEHGNVIVNVTCKNEGCPYAFNETTDAQGRTLRRYSVDRNFHSDEVTKTLYIYGDDRGDWLPVFERSEYYDGEGNLLRWNQRTTTLEFDSYFGYCVRVQRFSNSQGEYNEYSDRACRYTDEYFSQMASCTQASYSYQVCTVCEYKYYQYYNAPNGHSYSPVYGEDGYECSFCGFECANGSSYAVEIEWREYFDQEGKIGVGYYNRWAADDVVGINAQVSLVIATLDANGAVIEEESVTTVAITDDLVSKLFIEKEPLQAVLDTYEGNVCAMLKVTLRDGSDTVHWLKVL